MPIQSNRMAPRLPARSLALAALCWMLGGVLMLGAADGVGSDESSSLEYQVKAAFLAKLPHFVEWPGKCFPEEETPILIGILGEDPFGASFDAALEAFTINGRKLEVRRFNQPVDAARCHLLFVSNSERGRLDQIFAAVKDWPVVTVGELEGFARRGGMIQFIKREGRVGFEVNPGQASKAGVRLSAKLLQVSKIARDESEQQGGLE